MEEVARQLKEDLSSIILLLSEEELQVLVDVLCLELAQELGQSHVARPAPSSVLDQKEACHSRQLLRRKVASC